jgi:hypothetical protein
MVEVGSDDEDTAKVIDAINSDGCQGETVTGWWVILDLVSKQDAQSGDWIS